MKKKFELPPAIVLKSEEKMTPASVMSPQYVLLPKFTLKEERRDVELSILRTLSKPIEAFTLRFVEAERIVVVPV